ncbi:hypothetical protein NX059_002692 [Plenodomus lindquistii]|nr:hypothetical protein NX059_002692 [Plenodomus lindquistii]
MFTTHFTSVCINPALYLPWLLGQCLRHGVQVKRASLHHILDAAKLHHTGLTADVVINCTGLGAAQLHGVRDSTVVPVRGQTILVDSDPGCMIGVSGSDEGAEELTYVMKRAGGGGTVLGGSYHRALAKPEADSGLAARILRRCVSYCPQLAQKLQEQGNVDILSHRVGFRPCRTAGPRLEQERIGNTNIVHNYGHGGFGYQTSYACAYDVAKMVQAMAASWPLAKL